MTTRDVKLLGREPVAEGTMAFHFGKPPGFTFNAGEAVDLVLPGAADADPQDVRHAFSIVAAPFEDRLTFATRMRDSAFKRALKALPPGARAGIDGPFGSLAFHEERARPAVFIAGGIGITPFMSILKQAAKDANPRSITLVYSNRRPEDAAFLDELQALEHRNPRFRLVATMTDRSKSSRPWKGETRLVDAELLAKAAGGSTAPIHYLAGPPAMVEAIRGVLTAAGVHDGDIRSEDFFGY